MHDPRGVGRHQGPGDLLDQRDQGRQGWPVHDQFPERLAAHQLHDDERPALMLVHVMDRTDMRVVQGGCGPGLAVESLQHPAIPGEGLGQELQGHRPPSRVSSARYTSPIPPQPSRSWMM